MWHWLRRPWLAISAGLIGIILAVAVFQLPQLPGQLVYEPATAARWQLNTSTAYGIWGNLLLALGLFDVLRSPLLYLLLALLLPTLAAQLADQLGILRQLRRLQSYALTTPSPAPGTEIPIAPTRTLYRWRGVVDASPSTVANLLNGKITEDFATVERAEAPIVGLLPPVTPAEQPESGPESESTPPAPPVESRLRGIHLARLLYLRPLLMIGLLAAVVGTWIALAFGWQITAPPMAPGGNYRSVNRNLTLLYTVSPTATVGPALEVRLQGEEVTLSVDQVTQQRVGLAMVQVRPTYPAVWITVEDGTPRLALPGRSELRPFIGLVFATPGSEESVLLPNQGAGLRVVQRGNSNGFILELYRSNAVQPVYRAELTEGGQLTIPLDPGNVNITISTLPGLQVDVGYFPGLWLVWLGLGLSLIGALTFLRSTGFVVAQIAPWPTERTIVVLQADHPQTTADLRAALATITGTSPSGGSTGEPTGDQTSDSVSEQSSDEQSSPLLDSTAE
jgi:hypothetical protein